VSTPLEPLPQNSYADFAAGAPQEAAPINPDDPPWGVGAGFFVWASSVALMVVMNVLAIAVYVVVRGGVGDPANLNATLGADPNVTLYALVSMIPTHLATLAVAWAVVTNFGKRPFWQTVGWSWSPRFGPWASVGTAVLLLVAAAAVVHLFGSGMKTQFEEMLESSTQARLVTAFLAVAGAPLVEELVYRGVLYPALQRVIGVAWAVVAVATLFAVVHVAQYYNNPAVVFAVGSLGFALTYVRARTGRVLPCFVIHLVFNGLQVVALLAEQFAPARDDAETQAALARVALGFLPNIISAL
jgi:membrane protease YdiL (CAAX protease family)